MINLFIVKSMFYNLVIIILFRYKGGPALPRKMICEGVCSEKRVEVYPLSLQVIDSRDESQSVIILSKKVLTLFWFFLYSIFNGL